MLIIFIFIKVSTLFMQNNIFVLFFCAKKCFCYFRIYMCLFFLVVVVKNIYNESC